jgi:hypothetical protein
MLLRVTSLKKVAQERLSLLDASDCTPDNTCKATKS